MSANPVAPNAASVLLGLVGSGTARSYNVRACLASSPTNCKALTCKTVACGPLNGLASGGQYVVSATATLTTGQTVKASGSMKLTMPLAAAPILVEAEPAGRRKGLASALPPSTGPCSTYFWVFAPAAGGAAFNSTTDTLTITTASTALVPGGVYDTRVACVLNGRAAGSSRSLLQAELGPFSNTLRFVMPAAGAPFLTAQATGASTAEASMEPPTGTGARWWTGCVLQVLPGLPCAADKVWRALHDSDCCCVRAGLRPQAHNHAAPPIFLCFRMGALPTVCLRTWRRHNCLPYSGMPRRRALHRRQPARRDNLFRDQRGIQSRQHPQLD